LRFLKRRFLLAAVLLGAFLLADLALFGWLIVRSLSARQIEETLLETEREAAGLAARIAGQAHREGSDLFTAVARERETQTYIDSVLRQRDIVQSVEIRDRDGVVVLRSRRETTVPGDGAGLLAPSDVPAGDAPRIEPGAAAGDTPPARPVVETRSFEGQSTYDVTVPIADLGELYVGLSRGEIEQRAAVLRSRLLRQVGLFGAINLLLVAAACGVAGVAWLRKSRAVAQAEDAERMAYVGTLASGLAHEIRNPLNSLNLNMQLLEEELTPARGAGGARRLLGLTRSEIGRLERLVTDFLSFARPRPPELEVVPALRLLEHAASVLAPEIEAAGARLQVVDRAAGAAVRVDRAQLQQVLLNLIRNALQAMTETGRDRRLTLSAASLRGAVALEVSDSGPGIPKERQRRVFEAFYSTRKGGTGLGLAIVERVARAHGGWVEISSRPEHGTTIRVHLPAANEMA
jgi:signal transduction histidine kinase